MAQDIQKSYGDKERAVKESKVGDHVYFKVRLKKSSLKLGFFPELAAQFYGPFEILDRIEPVAYALALYSCFCVHNVFHVYLLKKYVPDLSHIID